MLKKFTLFTLVLAFVVILLGAYTRLEHAGLGCPDWPGCYGQLIAPTSESEVLQAESAYLEKVDVKKAWIEMIHRYMAGILSCCILALTFIFFKSKNTLKIKFLAFLLLPLLLMQALLGMWTVTLKLLPLVVMGHLLGGFSLLSVIYMLYLSQTTKRVIKLAPTFQFLLNVSLIALIMQIALGGWTSANYAAIVCPDFPYCHGKLLPESFDLFAFLPFSDLDSNSLITIHVTHRIGALIVFLSLLPISVYLIQKKSALGFSILFILSLQLLLGITNVLQGLPILVAVAHNGMAAILLLKVITTKYFSNNAYNQRLFNPVQT